MKIKSMTLKRTMVERIVLRGPMDESRQAFGYCEENGYRITRSGPRKLSIMQYDTSRYHIVAEREAE